MLQLPHKGPRCSNKLLSESPRPIYIRSDVINIFWEILWNQEIAKPLPFKLTYANRNKVSFKSYCVLHTIRLQSLILPHGYI